MPKKSGKVSDKLLTFLKKNLSLPSKLTIDNVYIFDPKIISEKFNDFFVNIGNNVEAKIPQPKAFSVYLKNRVNNSMFVCPVDDNEVLNMLNPSMSTCFYIGIKSTGGVILTPHRKL